MYDVLKHAASEEEAALNTMTSGTDEMTNDQFYAYLWTVDFQSLGGVMARV